jgi:hypothetical protein
VDELSKELHGDARETIPAGPGKPERIDYEYRRNGTANVFMFTEPLAGWRRALVTERRTAVDWAQAVKKILDEDYPDARGVRLVMDDLNMHRRFALPGVRAHRSPPPRRAPRDSLHAQAQLAQRR